MNKKKVAVIGAGIFGCSAALKLNEEFEVVLFERLGDFLMSTSSNNHLRHHYGYHYPRSKETALESIRGRKSFEEKYGECVYPEFPAYYALSNKDSKTTKENLIRFCKDLGLPCEEEWPEPEILDRSTVEFCIRVPESAYDPDILREIIRKRVSDSTISVNLNSEVTSANIKDGKKVLSIKKGGDIVEREFDYVVSAIYSNFNKLNKMFGFPKKLVQYALMELIDIRIPIHKKLAMTIIDGEFSTFIPTNIDGVVRLGNVKESVLKKIESVDLDTDLIANENILSNKEKILESSKHFYPILEKAEFVKSTFITRIVKANVEDTDERPTEITDHGNGIFSIFGGKVISCVDTANELSRRICSL